MGKFIRVFLFGIALTACSGNHDKISVVNANDESLNCLQIEQEISFLRKQRRDTLENIFYTDRNLVDVTTQRIHYLKTMYSYNKCNENNPKYTKVVIASL